MSLRSRLEADMKEAMRSRDRVRLETIRSVRGAIRNREIEVGEALDEPAIVRVIRSLHKQRVDSTLQFRAAGRDDLVEKESREKEVLESYLPASPGPDDIERAVSDVITELGATGPRDMGRVMKPVLARLGAAADGRAVSEVVKRRLAELAG